MKNIFLTRIDSSEENEVTLSRGEVCLGRGSIIGCDDKRISRNHGKLQISEDGSVTLVAMHSNPCFYKIQHLDSYAVLMKGQSKVLGDGDEFALLPNSFQYRIVVKEDGNFVPPLDTREGSGVNGDMTEMASKPKLTDQEQDTTHSGRPNDIENTSLDPLSATPSKRKRMLPSWLTGLSGNEPTGNTTTVHSSPSSSSATSRKRKASTAEVKTELKVESLDLGIDTIQSDNQVQSAAPSVTSNQHEISDEDNDVKPDTPSVTNNQHEISDEDNDVKPNVGQDKDGYEAEYGQASSTTTGSPNRDTGQNAASSSSRESCIYGATCYRKNPQHRVDFSHPGDPDFTVGPNLPECPYGTSCYRKNLQHRKDFKHTRPPLAMPMQAPRSPPQANGGSPTTKTRRKPRPATKDGDDSEDDYDYDDPFLNDASSDDYKPTSSEDSDLEEDDEDDEESQERKRMLREAKKFTKKKKK